MLLTHETSLLSPPPTHTPPISWDRNPSKSTSHSSWFLCHSLVSIPHSASYPHSDNMAVSSSQNVWEDKEERERKERDTLMLKLRMRKFSLLRNLKKASPVSLTQTGSSLHWLIPESVIVREDKVIITGLTITHSREDVDRQTLHYNGRVHAHMHTWHLQAFIKACLHGITITH